MTSWIDYMVSINETKEDIMDEESDYPAFMVNRGLSYFPDTIFFANEMNTSSHLDAKMQYEFYLRAIPKRRRRSKWGKITQDDDIEILAEYFNISDRKVREIRRLISKEDMEMIRKKMSKGGIQK